MQSRKQQALAIAFSFLGAISLIIGLFFSSFLLSAGTVLLTFPTFLNWKKKYTPIVFLLSVPFLSVLFSSLIQNALNYNYLLLKFSFVLFALFACRKHELEYSLARWIYLLLILVVTSINISSIINYLSYFEQINNSLLKSKSIPILAKIEHIYFGLISCSVSLSLFYFLFLNQKQQFLLNRKTLSIFFVINILSIHILSSRTGLVVLYVGLASMLLTYLIKRPNKIVKRSILALILLPILSFFVLPSFQNKMYNSMEDLDSLINRKDINHKSMAQRVESWRAAYWCISKKPIRGYTKVEEREVMAKGYQGSKSKLFVQNRLDIHTQYLAEPFFRGAFGLILFIFFVVYWFSLLSKSPLAIANLIGLSFSMVLEPLLERQLGFVIFLYLPLLLWRIENVEYENY